MSSDPSSAVDAIMASAAGFSSSFLEQAASVSAALQAVTSNDRPGDRFAVSISSPLLFAAVIRMDPGFAAHSRPATRQHSNQRAMARARNFIADSLRQVAAATRIQFEGSCVGENRLPGAHNTPSRLPAVANSLVSRPKSAQRYMPPGGGPAILAPMRSNASAVRPRQSSSRVRRPSSMRS